MLQRNPPLPAGLARRGARERHQRAACFAGNRHGPIAGQPLAPVLVAGLELLFDEQAAKAGTIHEQVGAHGFAAIELHGLDEAGHGVVFRVDHLAFGADDAVGFRILPQEARVTGRIELIGVTERGFDARGIGGRAS